MLKWVRRNIFKLGCSAGAFIPIFFPFSLAEAAPAPVAATSPPEMARLKSCRTVEDRDARLKCYDESIDVFNKAEADGHIVVVDSERVTEVRRQTFGFSFPSINLFASGLKSTPVDNIMLSVTGVQLDGNGRWIMTTGQGATWRLTETMQYGDPPHAGSMLQVKRGALGSFFCKIDGSPIVRCHRDQ